MADGRIDSVINQKKCIEELERVYEAMGKVADLIVRISDLAKTMNFGKGFKDTVEAMKNATNGLRELNEAKAEAVRRESELKQALLESKKANQDLKNQIEELRLAEAKRREEQRKRREEMRYEKGSIADLRNELKRLLAMWDSYGAASRRANKGVLDDIKRVQAELKRLEGDTGRYQRNVGNYPQVVGGLKGLVGTFGIPLGAAAIGKEIFDMTVKLDSLNSSLKAVSGSEAELSRNQAFLADLSERLGLNVVDLTGSFKNFYAAGTQAGLTANQTRAIFTSVSEVAANLKLSQDDVNGVFTAFGQIASKGKVQAEELRGQIGERIPGAFAIAARAIGVTQEKLNDMLKDGDVIATDFLPKFAKELERTFGVDNEKKVEGLQASINRLSNAFTNLVSDNQSALSRFFAMIIDLANETLVSINNLIGGIVYVSLKLTDKQAAQDFLNAKAIDEYAAKLKKLDTDNVLSQRNAIDQRIDIAENRLEGNLATIKSIRDAYGKNADAVYGAFLARTEKIVSEDQAALRLMQAQRQALVNELNRRYPGEEPTTTATPDAKKLTQKEINAAARLREAQIKAEMEARKIELQDAIESQKAIFENEKEGYEGRLVAAETYFHLKNILAQENAVGEKKILDEEIKLGKAVAAQKITVDKEANAQQEKNRRELAEIFKKVTKSSADEETKAILSRSEARSKAIAEAEDKELSRLSQLYTEGVLSREQYESAKLQVQNKYANESLTSEIQYLQEVIELQRRRGQDVEAETKRLNDLENKLRDENLKYEEDRLKKELDLQKAYNEKKLELEKQYSDKLRDLRQEIVDFSLALGDSFFEREKNKVQERIDDLDREKEAEIAAVNASTASQEEKAHQIAVIEAQSQAQRESLERRQRQIDQRAATFQKFMSLLQVGIATAEAVFKIQAQAAVLASNPVTAGLAGLAYAQIPVVIAAGALQAAAIAAKPIPRYKDGTENHPGGYARVGDGGVHEVIQSPDGRAWVTPNRDTLMDIPAHYKVHPSIDDYIMAAGASVMRPLPAIDGTIQSVDRLAAAVKYEYRKQTDRLLDGLEKNKTVVNVNNTHLGVKASAEKAQARIDFINREFKY